MASEFVAWIAALIEVEQFWRGSATPVVYNAGKKEEP
jgi:hypothetical protein